MKTLPNQTASESAPDKANSSTNKFVGTDNPRHLRAIPALLRRPMPREHLDREAGSSNGPDLVAVRRFPGIDIPCERVPDRDRDRDRRKVDRWLAGRK